MRLPIVKETTGAEIVAAFLRAARYQESAKVRWEAVDFDDETGAKGVIAYPCQARKKYRIFGPTVWARDFDAEIYLHPLAPNEKHDEIQINVRLAALNSSQRTVVSMADHKKWNERHLYLYRQLEMILKNAFLV